MVTVYNLAASSPSWNLVSHLARCPSLRWTSQCTIQIEVTSFCENMKTIDRFIRLRYRVKPIDGRTMEEAVDREYEYRLEGDLELKRVRSSICYHERILPCFDD